MKVYIKRSLQNNKNVTGYATTSFISFRALIAALRKKDLMAL